MAKPFELKLPVGAGGSLPKLFLDFIAGPEDGLGGLIQGYTTGSAGWSKIAAGAGERDRPARGQAWNEVVEDVRRSSERAGSSARILEKLERAKMEEVMFVLTGQQPGLLGGPLLILYKAFTAVVVADRLERLGGRSTIPLFWVAGDDADFEEIKSISLLGRDLAHFSMFLADDDYRTGSPVGTVPVASVAAIWDGLARFLVQLPGYEAAQSWLPDSLSGAADHGESFARVIARLTRGALAFVDGRSGAVRRCARSLMADYLEREGEVKRAVQERGEQLVRRGYHAQLSPGRDSGIFLIENGLRRAVPEDRRAELRDAIRTDTEACSPGVVLRTLVQDEVFRPAAVVLGPAEIAYRAQITDLFEWFDIPRPVVFPRLTATYFPPMLGELTEPESPETIELMLGDPAGYVSDLYESSASPAFRRAWDRFEVEFRTAVEGLDRAGREMLPAKLQGKFAGRLDDFQKQLVRLGRIHREAGREAALAKYPFLPNLADALKPRGRPQERVLSVLIPLLFSGPPVLDVLDALTAGYIDELLDGNACHIVYSR
jgi:uncharacterized protein YllA (UPF0747 family)